MIEDRLAAMLLRQARARGAPAWVLRALSGELEGATVEEAGDRRLVVAAPDGSRLELDVRLLLPPRPAAGERPWPAGLELPDGELRRLSYIVVDELVADAVVLSVSPWPEVDGRGRLVFSEEPAAAVEVSADGLLRYLQPPRFRGQPPEALRTGYAFAARVRPARLRAAEGAASPPSAWLVPPVYDIHSLAREKAKEAFSAAVAPTLSRAEAEQLRETEPRT